ncbi:MAG: hypothetical protein DRR16_29190 [Candidatus Parabeggiatoa sp. nov. 3]|nr:MAG: hypothetical protein DRR00_28290 [Gammaproteobacteria bacterium]RKZ57855.1 MAG: hypothetical protein DRQ99_26300 [Gammaproteobacteria bacterium]RKZ77685.1 MAG: hypothetical protein DRR16_29190 [Gammaproteobacteria bacterium]
MNLTAAIPTTDSVAIIREGWNLLSEQLGIEKATKFVILIERGKGDTVQEIADYWGNTRIEDIHNQIMNFTQKLRQTKTFA